MKGIKRIALEEMVLFVKTLGLFLSFLGVAKCPAILF